MALDRAKNTLVASSIEATDEIPLATTVTAMRLEPILRAHAYMNVEQPPELWEADTEDALFLPLLGEIIAAALSHGVALEELTLNASNVVVEPPEDDEDVMAPLPGEYVAITVRAPTDQPSQPRNRYCRSTRRSER